MNWLKINWYRIIFPIIIIGLFFAFFYSKPSQKTSVNNIVERLHTESPLRATGDITCTYPQVMMGSYNQDIITYEIPPIEKNPIIFTFSDMEEETAKLKYIDTTQTISETQLVKLSEDSERIVFFEAGQYYVALHTIFKEKGISIFSKQVSLFGIPSGTTVIGTCIDS